MLLLSLLACRDEITCGEGTRLAGEQCVAVEDTGATDGSDADADGDGYPADVDCDDHNELRNPGAVEVCDGLDNNCNDLVDDQAADASWWYQDVDRDGFGDLATAELTCTEPAGAVDNGDDCDDDDAAVHPGAEESCLDDTDYNCDGSVGYEDKDGDGWAACEECDDRDAAIYPKAPETCDEVDNDCDGDVDEEAVDATAWYADADGDGYGDPSTETLSCEGGSMVDNADDCDDGDDAVNPGEAELCDGADNDCDGDVDEDDAEDAGTWYDDSDGDGYGDPASATTSCEQPSGTVTNDDDCDDGDADLSPDTLWYLDADGDGWGTTTWTTTQCSTPSGYADNSLDCDDSDSSVSPSGSEVCGGADEDCDGKTDDDDPSVTGTSTWYRDLDGDGFGLSTVSTDACEAPSSYVADSTDCDDTDADVNPSGTEVCDGADNDCDGDVDADDSSVTGTSTYYGDTDGDGYGDAANTTSACSLPNGYVTNSSDCDDASSATHPGATEICDSADNDCDGSVDDGAGQTWYIDSDSDGYGSSSTTVWVCTGPSGYVLNDDDCDDSTSTISPAASETCDGLDNDCDGAVDDGVGTTLYRDADGDGYGSSSTTLTSCSGSANGYVSSSTDCDDGSSAVHPGAAEVCGDGVDQDCDGTDDSCGWTGTGFDTDATSVESYSGGDSVELLGDWDGDGKAEIAVGDGYATYDFNGTLVGYDGAVKIYEWDGSSLTGESFIEGNQAGYYFGRGLGQGDVTGDGVTDLLIGDWYAAPSSAYMGCAYVYEGPVNASHTYANVADRRICGDRYDAAGSDVGAADLDGDGNLDLIVGAFGYDASTNSVYYGGAFIFYGPVSAKTGQGDADDDADAFYYQSYAAYTGGNVENVGDLDGDGDEEAAVGGNSYVYVIDDLSGTETFSNATAEITASSGGSSWSYAERDLAGGDIDNDGYADLVVGSFGSSAWIFYGPVTGALNASSDAGATLTSHTGSVMSAVTVGDMDSDGNADVWVGSYDDSTGKAAGGSAWLFSGPISGTVFDYDYDAIILGSAQSRFLGYDVDSGEDLDGDGVPDLAVVSNGSSTTYLYLFTGI